jgi:superfamily I DNA/RNA helicase
MLDIVNKQQCQRIICGDSYQAIYEWRGAVDALSRALKHKPQLYLTQSFRFGNSIANAADEILMLLGATKSITGFSDDSRLKPLPNPQTVLCRTNGGVIGTLLNALMKEKRVHVAGGVEVLIAIIKGCQMLQDAGYSHHPELAGFFSWQELIACIEANEEDLGSLKVVANLVEKYGCYRLLNALQQTFPENRADLIVSTAHRAKGREWDSVRIAGDFQMLEAMQEIINHEGKVIKEQQTAELRLAYVAVTRAKKELDIGALCFGVDDE